jgi:predicted regulator of Ras-like GTPase activity (Roadblock/LC7/MglB family)
MPIQYRSEALRIGLQTLHRNAPSVLGSAIITQDGLVIAAYPPGWDADIHDPTGGEHVAAMAAVMMATAERTALRLAQGGLERMIIEGANNVLAVLPITPDSSLAILIEKDAKLGLTLHAARQAAEQIRGILNKAR